MMTQTCNPSSPEVEGGEESVQGHSGLHSDVKATMRYVRLYYQQTNRKEKRGHANLGILQTYIFK